MMETETFYQEIFYLVQLHGFLKLSLVASVGSEMLLKAALGLTQHGVFFTSYGYAFSNWPLDFFSNILPGITSIQ